jgi:hypothetical protein
MKSDLQASQEPPLTTRVMGTGWIIPNSPGLTFSFCTSQLLPFVSQPSNALENKEIWIYLLAVSYQSSAISRQLSVVSCQLSVNS